jgi:hypothetical protein
LSKNKKIKNADDHFIAEFHLVVKVASIGQSFVRWNAIGRINDNISTVNTLYSTYIRQKAQ